MTDETELPRCEMCGEPMPDGETMFKFHGFSGPCPAPPLPRPAAINWQTSYERAIARIAALEMELEAAKRDAELLWANCRVIYFPDPSGSYPLEHNMRACGTKDSRADIEAALRIDAARKEGP